MFTEMTCFVLCVQHWKWMGSEFALGLHAVVCVAKPCHWSVQ